MGKTSFGLNIISNVVLHEEKTVAFFRSKCLMNK
ncbi:MAG: hypothetical protein KHZ87_07605 [Clostridiales bacterium]|nr:hypothetical protein [Clostridiales bacterium]MBS5877102.1 hypothetical protein [Clostridiales bacterium]